MLSSARFGAWLRCWSAGVGALALTLASALGGCASNGPANAAPSVGVNNGAAPLIAMPPTSVGTWYELGNFRAPWMAGDAPVLADGLSAPTRVAGLRRDDGHWLAIMVVQTAPSADAQCPASNSLHVADETMDGGCLRMRGDADFDGWLRQQHSVLYRWLDGRGWTSRPRAWVGYRVSVGGHAIEAHALVDPPLLEPATRNNAEFLAGGQSARQWARSFAAATRAAGGGVLSVPPFPFAPQAAPPPEPLPTSSPPEPPRGNNR
ncbi:MAG: hypothetical protein LBE78_04275 [Burkholderiaceae bacterium]|nr:hypothetical protein [Burkholderiaceae bacterium]